MQSDTNPCSDVALGACNCDRRHPKKPENRPQKLPGPPEELHEETDQSQFSILRVGADGLGSQSDTKRHPDQVPHLHWLRRRKDGANSESQKHEQLS